MNTIGQSRTFKKNADYVWRIYKFENESELKHFQKVTNSSFFTDAIKIVSEGMVYADTLDWLNSMSDDIAWRELFIKCGDFVIITKENLSKKETALRKYKEFSYKLLKNKSMETNQNQVDPKKKENTRWSASELALIWSASPKEVGETLGRTAAAVTYQRVAYKHAHPEFIAPPEAKSTTTNNKMGRPKGVKNKKKDIAVQQTQIQPQKIQTVQVKSTSERVMSIDSIEQEAIANLEKLRDFYKNKADKVDAMIANLINVANI